MADYTWQGIPNEPSPTGPAGDRTCPSGVCGGGSGPGNIGLIWPSSPYSDTYPAGERYAGQWTLGDQDRANRLACQQRQEMRLMYENMLLQFGGPEGTWIRMLIKDRMSRMMSSELDYRQASRGITPPAIPDWMEPYIATSEVPMQGPQKGDRPKGRWAEGKTKTVTSLRPLSAQADLTPDQLAFMSGWQAWQQAGAPTKYSPEALARMSDIERSWTPYGIESQLMFPQWAGQTPQWTIAQQR